MWKQTGSGQIFITFLFTAMPETKKVYGILMRSVRRIPVILKSGTGKRRRSPGTTVQQGTAVRAKGSIRECRGPGSAIRRPTAPEMGTETKRNMEVLLEADPAKSAGPGFWQRRTVSGCLHQDGHGHSGRLWTSDHPYGGSFRCGIHVSDTVCAWTGAVHFPRGRDKLLCNGMQNLGAV